MSIITHDQWSLPWNAIDHTWSVLINGLYRDPYPLYGQCPNTCALIWMGLPLLLLLGDTASAYQLYQGSRNNDNAPVKKETVKKSPSTVQVLTIGNILIGETPSGRYITCLSGGASSSGRNRLPVKRTDTHTQASRCQLLVLLTGTQSQLAVALCMICEKLGVWLPWRRSRRLE